MTELEIAFARAARGRRNLRHVAEHGYSLCGIRTGATIRLTAPAFAALNACERCTRLIALRFGFAPDTEAR